jgi:hypothetical protein
MTGGTRAETPEAPGVDMKLEVVVVPVSDVDQANAEYMVRERAGEALPT